MRNLRSKVLRSRYGAGMYKANIEGEGNQNSCRNGSAWVRNRPVDRVLSSYTGVEKSGTNEISMEGVGGSVPGVVIHGR